MGDFEVRFDSRNDYFRHPAGALKSGSTLELVLEISGYVNVQKAEAVVLYDRHTEPAFYEMKLIKEGDLDAYKAEFTVNDSGLYWYHFQIKTDLGFHRIGKTEFNRADIHLGPEQIVPWQLTVYEMDFEEPVWIYGGIYYHIFIDRFYKSTDYKPDPFEICKIQGHKGLPARVIRDDWGGMPEFRPVDGRICNNDFFGGNLKGIEEKLPYLEKLGVSCIYLSPVFESYSNHKYDTGDYLKIDPSFGTEKEFTSLCKSAGERGIRVILDGVFSHTGSDSVYFDKYGNYGGHGAFTDPQSEYRKWYDLYEDGSYETWWGIDTLPRVRKEDPDFQKFITAEDGVVPYWMKKGAYGWRLDVVDELPADFTRKVCCCARKRRKDALMIGEVWEDASSKEAYEERKNYFEGDKINSVMNYPLKNAIIDFVRNGKSQVLTEVMESQMENYPPFAINSLMNLLGSHDSVRIITALAGEILPQDASREQKAATALTPEQKEQGIHLLKMASLLQMTLPGVPCIYYGDEIGMEGYNDPFNRKCFPWGQENEELLEWYRKLTGIRRNHDVYKTGSYRTVSANDGFFAFERTCKDSRMITAVNRNRAGEVIELDGNWMDLLTGRIARGSVIVHPDGGVLLEKL